MIDNPEDVQLVKNALKHLEDLRTSMEDSGDWDGTAWKTCVEKNSKKLDREEEENS